MLSTYLFLLWWSWEYLYFMFWSSLNPKYELLAIVKHDDVIKWKHVPHYWPFARGIHRSPVNAPHKGQWRGALMFSLICTWTNGWLKNRDAGDLRRNRAHYDITVMGLGDERMECAARLAVFFILKLVESSSVRLIFCYSIQESSVSFRVINCLCGMCYYKIY